MSVKYLLLIYSLGALNPFSKEAKTTKVIVKTSFEISLFFIFAVSIIHF